MESKPCNVVLLPTTDLATKAIALSEKIHNDQSFFTLKDGAYFPHASIYMLELKIDDYEKIQQILEDIARMHGQFNLQAYKYDQKMGFIDAEYAISPKLNELQDHVVTALNPLRNGMREKDIQRMEQAEGIKRRYFEQYGYPNIYELFRPHLSFTRFDSDELYDTSLFPDVSEFSGTFDRLGFFESGDNGTCIKLISSHQLAKFISSS
jgi:hypothetical protein